MPFKIENKINQLEYLHSAWQIIYYFDADDLENAQSQIEKAIMSISQELVEIYRAEKLNRHIEKLSK